MSIPAGEVVVVTIPENKQSFEAIVRYCEDGNNRCVLEASNLNNELKGKRVLLHYKDKMYTAIIEEVENNNVNLTITGEERRSFFRVDDAFPIKIKKIDKKPLLSRFLTYYAPSKQNSIETEYYDDAIMRSLLEINRKLDYLINTIILKEEGLSFEEIKPVNISASGIRLEMEEKAEVGDVVELKMVLPSHPPVALVTYGEVVRVDEKEVNGKTIYDTAVKFTEMSEEIRDEIIRYTLKREREIIKSKKLKET